MSLMHHCERCNKPATVHMTEISGGKPHDVHLCDACAQQAGYVQTSPVAQSHVPINELLNQFLKTHANVAETPASRCPDCGMTWQEFKDTGLLGCPKDYELFLNQLGGVIERAQNGANHHTGKNLSPADRTPKKADAVKLRQAELSRLRKELARAVEDESYERAAQLRDQIRGLESA
jgi:protein arginine kinase activator